jgi:hypothetical protein
LFDNYGGLSYLPAFSPGSITGNGYCFPEEQEPLITDTISQENRLAEEFTLQSAGSDAKVINSLGACYLCSGTGEVCAGAAGRCQGGRCPSILK